MATTTDDQRKTIFRLREMAMRVEIRCCFFVCFFSPQLRWSWWQRKRRTKIRSLTRKRQQVLLATVGEPRLTRLAANEAVNP